VNYTKPEVAVLGNASAVIESTITPKNVPPSMDFTGLKAPTPAYDLDE